MGIYKKNFIYIYIYIYIYNFNLNFHVFSTRSSGEIDLQFSTFIL